MRLLVLGVLAFFGFMFFRRRAGVPVPTSNESFVRLQEIQELSFSATNNTLTADQKDRFLFLLGQEFGPESAQVKRFRRIFGTAPVAPAPQIADPLGIIPNQPNALIGGTLEEQRLAIEEGRPIASQLS